MKGTDPLELIAEGRAKLAVEDRSGWADVALSDRMSAVTAKFERLGAEMVRLTAEWNAQGAWGADGFVSPTAWLAAHGRMTRTGAGRIVRSARHVARFAATGDTLADARVTSEKVELLAEAARHREEFYERDEELLLDLVSRLDARDLAVALRTWRMLADDEAADDDANDAFDRVHLDIANGLLGSELAGFLDPHGATVLANALDLIERPDPTIGPTTSSNGSAAAPPTWTTLPCCTDATTSRSTKAASGSSATPTARSASSHGQPDGNDGPGDPDGWGR